MRRRSAIRPLHGGGTVLEVAQGPTGLVRFEVSGRVGGHEARAEWDGGRLRLNRAMCDAVTLSLAVEAVFAPTCGDRPPSLSDPPMGLATELVRSLDHVDRIEYSSRCPSGVRHRLWSPETAATPQGSPDAPDAPDAPRGAAWHEGEDRGTTGTPREHT